MRGRRERTERKRKKRENKKIITRVQEKIYLRGKNGTKERGKKKGEV